MGRRRFTREFKIEAVRRVLEGDRTIAEVARELGVGAGLLGRWKAQFEADTGAFPGKGRLKESDERVRRLERENRELRQENAFLKKTASYFARDDRGGSK